MGFCKKYTEFSIGHEFNYVGIRFLPTMFPQLCALDYGPGGSGTIGRSLRRTLVRSVRY